RDAKPQAWPNLPVVVLANGGTASAAEIITGALQDHDRAVVVGTPTFGKGLVQSLWQLTPETALKLTTARWYTPSGRTIQRRSKNEDDQLAQAEAAGLGRDTTKVDSSLVFHTDHGRADADRGRSGARDHALRVRPTGGGAAPDGRGPPGAGGAGAGAPRQVAPGSAVARRRAGAGHPAQLTRSVGIIGPGRAGVGLG